VALRDGVVLGDSFERSVEEITVFRPDLVVVHTVTPTFNSDLRFCARVREALSAVPIALVGTHAAALGPEALEEAPADLVVAEEGERPLAGLARGVAGGATADDVKEAALSVPGFWVRSPDGTVSSTGDGPLVSDLDSLPFPARDLLPNDRYRMPFFEGEPFATLIPSRGCPWSCTFCRSGITWGDTVRTRSTGNVIEEIDEIRTRFGIRNLVFMTDTFTYHRDWVMELCRGIRDRFPGLRWICNSRVDTVDPERLRLMADAGCRMVSYGVESADAAILKACRKEITPEQSRQAIQWTREAGIEAFAYFILGLPGETQESIRKTVDFAIDIEPDYALFHIATPFPGTDLYRLAREKGWLLTDDWDRYEEDGDGVMRTESLDPEDLRRAQKAAFRRFYLRPSRLRRELGSIRSPRDLKAKFIAGLQTLRR